MGSPVISAHPRPVASGSRFWFVFPAVRGRQRMAPTAAGMPAPVPRGSPVLPHVRD